MIAIVDYGMGNLRSVQKKVKKLGGNVRITSSPEVIRQAEKIILPGVGHFKKAVQNIKKLSLWDTLNTEVKINKKPILGICLGMQLMAKHSEEGNENGFGWIDANVVKFKISNKLQYKIPHIGWNQVEIKKESQILAGIDNKAFFYFVHSYFVICNNVHDVLAESEYEQKFVSAIEHENIIGVQFHPEKSLDVGEILFRNFLEM